MEISGEPQVSWSQLAVVLLVTVVPYAYWWYIIVPTRRRELAGSKRRGDVKEYLEELASAPTDERKAEKWMYDKYLREAKLVDGVRQEGLTEAVAEVENRLQDTLPGGGFWSFDNPVFVYFVLFGAFSTFQIVAHAFAAR